MQIVTTKTPGGLSYYGLLSEPQPKTETIIIHIHGLSGSIVLNSFYPAMHTAYPQAGISFLVVEHSGTGSVTQFDSEQGVDNRGNAFELIEESYDDIQGWINFAKSLGCKNIWLQAHSLGPTKVAKYLAQSNENLAGLIFLSPADMIGLVLEPNEKQNHDKMLAEAKQLLSEDKPRQLLNGYLWGNVVMSAQTYHNFFGDDHKTAVFNYSHPEFGWELVNKIALPVIAFTGTKDDAMITVMDPYKAMDTLSAQLMNSPRKLTVVYKDADHDFQGFGAQIAQEVIQFINS